MLWVCYRSAEASPELLLSNQNLCFKEKEKNIYLDTLLLRAILLVKHKGLDQTGHTDASTCEGHSCRNLMDVQINLHLHNLNVH